MVDFVNGVAALTASSLTKDAIVERHLVLPRRDSSLVLTGMG
jgi:hypothetical protein